MLRRCGQGADDERKCDSMSEKWRESWKECVGVSSALLVSAQNEIQELKEELDKRCTAHDDAAFPRKQ